MVYKHQRYNWSNAEFVYLSASTYALYITITNYKQFGHQNHRGNMLNYNRWSFVAFPLSTLDNNRNFRSLLSRATLKKPFL